MSEATTGGIGRRDRNMRDKRERIFNAAAELFAERGFAAVSTQQVSERADVAAGTLFRYASSKGELLLMVYNDEFREALDIGEARAAEQTDVVESIVQMVLPIIDRVQVNPENSQVYQRELIFGPATEQFRADGLAIVAQLEARIASRLLDEARKRNPEADERRAALASSGVFAIVHLAVVRSSMGTASDTDPVEDLRIQVGQIVAGYFAQP
ncbi:TetR/AcrR family transcriptional regulator [Plantibacter sp. YIM 135347]|uniref:TetR/AcrR family transcriptional regulator n=1 Tax=Plantibacter sp. YIM 135347 TaxID=3423919 RepID=UPI003D333B17